MDSVYKKSFALILFLLSFFIPNCKKNPSDAEDTAGTAPLDLIVPYISDSDVTYIQPFGVPLDFGGGDIRPHAAIDFGCDNEVEFVASASGTLGNIWLEYTHSYQFNIVIDEKHIVHYCMEPIHIDTLSDQEKLDAIYFSPGESIQKGQKICKMVGGPGHMDWGLIIDNERVCPACHLPDEEYAKINTLFKSFPGVFPGYDNLCPVNDYHSNPRE
jgi:hypothetical protein